MSKQISIDRIIIEGLFDQINYDINFKNPDSVSILIAPNGCGKTTVFKMINFITSPSLSSFKEIVGIPFKSFECFLSNGFCLRLCFKEPTKKQAEKRDALIKNTSFAPTGASIEELKKIFNYNYSIIDNTGSVTFEKAFVDWFKALHIGGTPSRWHFEGDDDEGFFEEEIGLDKKYSNILSDNVDYYFGRDLAHLFETFNLELSGNNCKINTLFITANRVKEEDTIKNDYRIRSRGAKKLIKQLLPLNKANATTIETIRSLKEQYNNNLSNAKDELIKKYLEANEDDFKDESFEDFSKRWNAYYDELEKYAKIGFISGVNTFIEPENLKDAYRKKRTYLNTHLAVFEKTLSPLQGIYDKYKLLSDILNQRNEQTGKKIKFNEKGIHIISNEKEISLDCLSSGEKNDLIMFYSLIFDTNDTSLVLIDEPEISLHIAWQEQYIDYLLKICKTNGFQAIIATHSPNIINGHFDLLSERNMENYD